MLCEWVVLIWPDLLEHYQRFLGDPISVFYQRALDLYFYCCGGLKCL